ncbi:uncharacterized protein LOC62_07G009679 [Vanrija pseudolonga]|uniref:Uncharacterized protein n=1 Tax=Vanrija pseudolonga TaxID=143232 RepID=A0AAF0YGI0_9TREE|nr:hypothetical protein LOC62_07G009679 [Vanrija pseudolonga]
MPKRSDVHHITAHLHKSAVFVSVPESTTLAQLKTQLVAALASLEGRVPVLPASEADIQLWEDREIDGAAEGEQGIRVVEGEGSVLRLGWPRWKRVYVSVRAPGGEFERPVYTVPDPMDGEGEEDEQA